MGRTHGAGVQRGGVEDRLNFGKVSNWKTFGICEGNGMISLHLKSLFKFSGRESKGQFWPWAGIVFALVTISALAVTGPAIMTSISRMQEFARAHPEQATVMSGPGYYQIRIDGVHPELAPDLGMMIPALALVMGATVLLLAAAVARRLHDTGRTGLWGLMPLPFLLGGIGLMQGLFHDVSKGGFDGGAFMLVLLNNMIYLASLAALIVLLALPGSPGANRFGPPAAG